METEPIWFVCDMNPAAIFYGFDYWIANSWSLTVRTDRIMVGA